MLAAHSSPSRAYLLIVIAVLTLATPAATSQNTMAPGPLVARAAQETDGTPIADRPGDTDPALYKAILPEHRERIYNQTAGLVSRYTIEAELVPGDAGEPAFVTGTVELRYVNETAAAQGEIFLRLYPNDPAYNEAEMTVSRLLVQDNAVDPALSESDTVLAIPLPQPVLAGEAVDIELDYRAIVPVRPAQSYGIFAVDPEANTIALAHWFPILAGIDSEEWSLEPVSRNGDPIFSNVALFDVRLTTPSSWLVAATGVEIDEQTAAEVTTRRLVSGPVRDFTVVTSDQFETASREVDGTRITSYFRPESAAGGEAVVDYGERAMTLFSSLLIPYPYREMDFVEVELYGAAGVEFPQLMYLAHAIYEGSSRNEHYLEFVTAHEVVHQWLYGLVGNNQHRAAYIDEGLDQFLSSDVYFSAIYGPEAGRRQYALEILHWYLGSLQSGNDVIVSQATDDFSSSATYSVAVYAKAAVGFAQIRDLIGDEAFFAALKTYTSRYQFKVATPADLKAAFASESDADIEAVWHTWFNEARGTEFFRPEDYDELLIELGLR